MGAGSVIGVVLLILFVFLLAIGLLLKFKASALPNWSWLQKLGCKIKGPDGTLFVEKWAWDGSNCVANVCADGYGSTATGGLPDSNGVCSKFPAARTYSSVGAGLCQGASSAVLTVRKMTNDDTATACGVECDGFASCTGYDWNNSSKACNMYTDTIAMTDGKVANIACYNNPK